MAGQPVVPLRRCSWDRDGAAATAPVQSARPLPPHALVSLSSPRTMLLIRGVGEDSGRLLGSAKETEKTGKKVRKGGWARGSPYAHQTPETSRDRN